MTDAVRFPVEEPKGKRLKKDLLDWVSEAAWRRARGREAAWCEVLERMEFKRIWGACGKARPGRGGLNPGSRVYRGVSQE